MTLWRFLPNIPGMIVPPPSPVGPSLRPDMKELPRCGVLVVDDEPDLIEEISEYLQAQGYPLHLAPNGVEALSLYRAQPPGSIAVVLSDLRMPGMNGHALARAILAETAEAVAVEVVIITGHGALGPGSEAPDRLFAELRKPFRLSELTAVVGQAHDAAMARRAAAAPDGGPPPHAAG